MTVALVASSGCASYARIADDFDGTFERGEAILLVDPDVELSMLSLSGLPEPRADWSGATAAHLRTAFESALGERGLDVIAGVSGRDLAKRHTQLFRLKDAVVRSIRTYSYDPDDEGDTLIVFPSSPETLPSKKDAFDWTLGRGAAALAEGTRANFALFVTVRGNYESTGRSALNSLFQAFQLGKVRAAKQELFVALVELETGDVLWTNLAWFGRGGKGLIVFDLREPAGAKAAVTSLLNELPP